MTKRLTKTIQRKSLFGVPFDTVDMEMAIRLASEAMTYGRRLQHSDVNVSKFVDMKRSPDLQKFVEESDLICVDGMGILLACKLFGISTSGRVTGIDLMEHILNVCSKEGFRPYFLGSKPEILELMIERLTRKYSGLKIAGWRHGYFEKSEENSIVKDINETGADCLFVGISSPTKERFLHTHRDKLRVPLQVGVGGAFDVVSGQIKRAPVFMQQAGLEWFFRLAQEPRRLTGRYVNSNLLFLGLLGFYAAKGVLGSSSENKA